MLIAGSPVPEPRSRTCSPGLYLQVLYQQLVEGIVGGMALAAVAAQAVLRPFQ